MGEERTGGKVVAPTLDPLPLAYESYVSIFTIHSPVQQVTTFRG